MNKSSSNMAKGLGIGITVGAAMGVAGTYVMKSNKKVKKAAVKALKSVGDAFSGVQNMMK